MTDQISPTPPRSTFWSADRVGGLIWVILGGAIVYGSWTMDRLESLKIPLATAPGVVPGLLGLFLMLFGAILLARRAPAADVSAHADDPSWPRVLTSWGLCIAYAGLLMGRGIPYWLLTATFLLAHLMLIGEATLGAWPERRRLIAILIIVAILPVTVGAIFQHIFLVRLP